MYCAESLICMDDLLCIFAVNECFVVSDNGQHMTAKNDAALSECNQSDMVALVKNYCDTCRRRPPYRYYLFLYLYSYM